MPKPTPVSPGPTRRAALALLAATGWPAAHAARDVTIGGTGTGLAPVRRVLEGSSHPIAIVPSLGTGGGLKALAAGALDIALAARRLTDAERAAGLVAIELFRTPFVWATNPGVPIIRPTRAALAALYAGEPAKWSDGQPVRLVLRPENDSDTTIARTLGEEMVRGLALAARRPGMNVAVTDDDALADIERIPGALGSTTLAMALANKSPVRVLELDDVVPTVAALAAGRWPLFKSVFLVTRGAPAGPAAPVVQALTSVAGTQAFARLGCLAAAAG